jgi:hypothetical protein
VFGWFVAGLAAAKSFFFSDRSLSQNWLQEVINGTIIAAIAIQIGFFIPTLLKIIPVVRK